MLKGDSFVSACSLKLSKYYLLPVGRVCVCGGVLGIEFKSSYRHHKHFID